MAESLGMASTLSFITDITSLNTSEKEVKWMIQIHQVLTYYSCKVSDMYHLQTRIAFLLSNAEGSFRQYGSSSK